MWVPYLQKADSKSPYDYWDKAPLAKIKMLGI
jgi:hypothetical protein